MIKFPLLTSEDVEVKVKQITKSGALMLLYKTARVDARVLDDTVGPMNWTCDFREIKDNLFCRIGVREDVSQDFVYKEDCGIESGQDDGNEKKAEASDAFKRAAVKWGIGRELYTSPQIWASVATVERNGKWFLQDPYAKYVVTRFECNQVTRVITALEITNAKSGVVVFRWEMPTNGAIAQKMVKTFAGASPEAPAEEPAETSDATAAAPTLEELKRSIVAMLRTMATRDGNRNAYAEILIKVTGDTSFKCNVATQEQYDTVAAIAEAMKAAGYGN